MTFNWYGINYPISGGYTRVLANDAGCDSTVKLHRTVQEAKQGVSVIGEVLTADAAGANYHWVNLAGETVRIEKNITSFEDDLINGELKKGIHFIELRGPQIFPGKIIIE